MQFTAAFSAVGSHEWEAHMADVNTPTELTPVTAEQGREKAESARTEAEGFRVVAEEARVLREQHREELEALRQEREALRHAAEDARQAAEDARHATIASVAATADALRTSLAQMQFLEDARSTLRQLRSMKPDDVQ